MQNPGLEKQVSLPADIENIKKELDHACSTLKKLKEELKAAVSNSIDINSKFITSGISILDVKVEDIKKNLNTLSLSENNSYTKESLTEILNLLKTKPDKSAIDVDNIPILADIEELNDYINLKFENTETLFINQIKEINQNINTKLSPVNNELSDNIKSLVSNLSTKIGAIDALTKNTSSLTITEIAKIADKLDKQVTSQEISKLLNDLSNFTNNITNVAEDFTEVLEDSNKKLSNTIISNIENARKNDEYCETLKEFVSNVQLIFSQIDNKFSSNALHVNEQFDMISSNLSYINENSEKIQNLLKQLPQSVNNDNDNDNESIKDQLLEITDKLNSLESLTRNSLHLTIDELKESLNSTKSDIKADIKANIETLSSEIQDSISDAIDPEYVKSQLLY